MTNQIKKQPPEVFCKKDIFKSFAKLTGKHLCRSQWQPWGTQLCYKRYSNTGCFLFYRTYPGDCFCKFKFCEFRWTFLALFPQLLLWKKCEEGSSKLLKLMGFLSQFLSKFYNTHFFYKQRLFSTLPQCCLTFSWFELQILFSCCLIHISTIVLWHNFYLINACPFLGPGLFQLYLCDLLSISSLTFIKAIHIILLKQMHLCFYIF